MLLWRVQLESVIIQLEIQNINSSFFSQLIPIRKKTDQLYIIIRKKGVFKVLTLPKIYSAIAP